MKYQVKKISALQTSKISAICNAPWGLIHTLVGLWILMNPTGDPEKDAVHQFVGMLFLFMPLIIGVITFLSTFILSHFYNWLASMMGGIEFELEEQDE